MYIFIHPIDNKDSCIFDKTLVRAIDLRLSAVEQGVLLGMPFNLCCFHIWGKFFPLNESLNISVSGTANTYANSFKIFKTGSFGHGALLTLFFISSFRTSSTLTLGRLSGHSNSIHSSFMR